MDGEFLPEKIKTTFPHFYVLWSHYHHLRKTAKSHIQIFILDSSLEPNHCNTYKALGMLIIKGAGALLLPLGDVPNREEVLVLPIQVRT